MGILAGVETGKFLGILGRAYEIRLCSRGGRRSRVSGC